MKKSKIHLGEILQEIDICYELCIFFILWNHNISEFLSSRKQNVQSLLYIFFCFYTAYQPCGGYSTCKTDHPDNTSKTLKILGITFGCVILCVSIILICIHNYKRKLTSNQSTISPARNQNVRAQDIPLTNTERNARRPNGTQAPYASPMPAAWTIHEEEPPPTYASFMSSSAVRN
jgi:hypothetical protein